MTNPNNNGHHMPRHSLILLCLSVMIIGLGQIGMKYVALKYTYDSAADFTHNLALNKPIIALMCLVISAYVLAMGLWIIALRDVPLSLAYPFTAFAFIFVPILALIIFGERVNIYYFIGLIMIIIGILFCVRGGNV